jgi:Protein of unknown function (DUF4058)
MPSPFPGMDPYAEGWIWGDFHLSFVTALRAQLNARLPKRYVANAELYIWREDPADKDRMSVVGPDSYVADRGGNRSSESPVAVATLTPPVTTVLTRRETKHRYLRIVESQDRRVVTVIEVLSPSNKTASSMGDADRLKRDEYIAGGLNLVEIDLLRAGIRPPLGDPSPPVTDYYVLVNRASDRPRLGIWPFSVRETLPQVPVPIDDGVPDLILELRPALDRVYDEGRYADQLDYSVPPPIPLREPDATWARELLSHRTTPTHGTVT